MTETSLRVVVPHSGRRAAPPVVSLDIVRGQAKNRHRLVSAPAFLIGRAADCDLVLADQQFPEVHAYLLLRGVRVVLQHLGFAPQMTVNGDVATKMELEDGDRIRTGPYEFVIRIRQPGDDRSSHPVEEIGPASEHGLTRPDYDADAVSIVQQLVGDIRVEMAPTAVETVTPLRIFTPKHAG